MREPVPGQPQTGVLVPPHIPARDLVGYAQKAEQLGFAEAWVAEDCFLHGAVAQAATILASTRTLHIGIGIIPAAARNVAFTAMEIATLAGLHPGRLTVGVGHGMPGWLDQAAPGRQAPSRCWRNTSRRCGGCSKGSAWTTPAATCGSAESS